MIEISSISSPSFECREIWGGNGKREQDIQFDGLKGFLLSRPYESAEGGDLHFLSFCDQAALSKIVVADVSGHGDIVSRAALNIKTLLLDHINEVDNSKLLISINDSLNHRMQNGEFVTMVAATFHSRTKSFIYAYAGHPALFRYDGSAAEWRILASDANTGVPLGIIGGTQYVQMETTLKRGDLLLFYTDGLLNVRKKSGGQITVEELLSLCQEVAHSSLQPRRIVASLIDRINSLSSTGFTDDVTLLVLEVM